MTTSTRTLRYVAVLAIGALTAFGAPGVAAAQSADAPVAVTVSADAMAGLPDAPAPGWYTFEVTNATAGGIDFNVGRINKGYDEQDLETLDDASPKKVNKILTFIAGTTVEAGATSSITFKLPKGSVVFNSFVEENESELIETLAVKGATTDAEPPDADVVTEGFDFGYDIPETVPADAEWEFANTGKQWHVLATCKLVEGKTFDDALDYAKTIDPETGVGEGEDPCPEVPGGFGAISGKVTVYGPQTFEAGDYVAFCYLPDTKTGKPHYLLGMTAAFTVE